MYYDASWRLVEERVDESYVSLPGLNRHMQNLWGARYIDDLIARRRDANRDGDCLDAGDATCYAVTDVQFSVVAMLTSTGKLHERVAYDSYGTARHHWKDDVDGDGDVDSSDKSAVTALLGKAIYQSGYNPAADIDRSGTIDSADASLVSSKVIAALAAGEISDRTTTGPDNTIGYDGYVFNPENLLYTVRFRHYDTGLGRWIERDPAGYVDGTNAYLYARSNALRFLDSLGLSSVNLPEKMDGGGDSGGDGGGCPQASWPHSPTESPVCAISGKPLPYIEEVLSRTEMALYRQAIRQAIRACLCKDRYYYMPNDQGPRGDPISKPSDITNDLRQSQEAARLAGLCPISCKQVSIGGHGGPGSITSLVSWQQLEGIKLCRDGSKDWSSPLSEIDQMFQEIRSCTSDLAVNSCNVDRGPEGEKFRQYLIELCADIGT